MSNSAILTSPVAVLEAALGLARADKFGLSVEAVKPIILEFLDERGIEIRDLPPPKETTDLALSAAHRYRQRNATDSPLPRSKKRCSPPSFGRSSVLISGMPNVSR